MRVQYRITQDKDGTIWKVPYFKVTEEEYYYRYYMLDLKTGEETEHLPKREKKILP